MNALKREMDVICVSIAWTFSKENVTTADYWVEGMQPLTAVGGRKTNLRQVEAFAQPVGTGSANP